MDNAVVIGWKVAKAMNCLNCGIYFRYPSKVKNRKYCNIKCQHKSLIGKKESEEHKIKRIFAIKNSEKYKESLKTRKYPVNNGRFGIRQYSGDKHHNWKGGITPLNEKLRRTRQYKEWRIAVFERDNYTCQICNVRGATLNADHIKPFAYYPDLRFELSNGRTLCVSCHKQTDTFMGRARWNQE